MLAEIYRDFSVDDDECEQLPFGAQARSHGVHIVAVNFERAVSPFTRNLSHLRPGDVRYRMTADAFFRNGSPETPRHPGAQRPCDRCAP